MIDGQENAGFQIDVAGQTHILLPQEGGRPQQDGFPVDRAAKAALLIEAQVLSRFPWGVLPHRQSLKDPLQAAARRTGGCRRISRHLS